MVIAITSHVVSITCLLCACNITISGPGPVHWGTPGNGTCTRGGSVHSSGPLSDKIKIKIGWREREMDLSYMYILVLYIPRRRGGGGGY